MQKLSILNDLHLGVQRVAGTTPASAARLRKGALDAFANLVSNIHNDLGILGDMFDGYSVPLSDAYEAMSVLQDWLKRGHKLFLIPGNHDLASDSGKLGTFQFIAKVLRQTNSNVTYVGEAGFINDDTYVIPHLANQDLFDYELSRVPECKFLLLHCNYDNKFAREQDHSLNLSEEAAKASKAKVILLAHEHQQGSALAGKVIKIGNQFPTSVSDCIGGQNKRMAEIIGDQVLFTNTWYSQEGYCEVDWKKLSGEHLNYSFVRVVGQASASEAADAVDAVAKFRRVATDTLVVTSAVRHDTGQDIDMTEALASVESVKQFDVYAALKEALTEKQYEVIQNLK